MAGITIVGLGPGEARWLTRAAWDVLAAAPEVWLRTGRHPTVAGFPAGLASHAFDELYEAHDRPEQVYAAIAARVVELGAREQGVVYAVPGHPNVAEATVQLVKARAAEAGLAVTVVAGLSFLEPVLEALEADALPRLQLADALELAGRHHPPFHPDAPALIAQLYSPRLASDVKLTLMNQYPDEHPVRLVHGAGTGGQRVESLPLYEIDRSPHIAHLTALFVPPLERPSAFETFQETIAHLRAPEGCPWDREQTHQSLRRNLLEETYEVLQAIDEDDAASMREEFGDLLLQIVLHSQIAIEAGEYSMADVIADIQAKIIRRHPHVFGEVRVNNAADVARNWEMLKAAERQHLPKPDRGVLGDSPPGLPSLAEAESIQKRAAKVGFDWPEASGVVAKIREELDEVAAASSTEEQADEVGDLLFAVVNWARWLEIDAESALRQANARFAGRFRLMEAQAREQGRQLDALTPAEWDGLWTQAKRRLKGGA